MLNKKVLIIRKKLNSLKETFLFTDIVSHKLVRKIFYVTSKQEIPVECDHSSSFPKLQRGLQGLALVSKCQEIENEKNFNHQSNFKEMLPLAQPSTCFGCNVYLKSFANKALRALRRMLFDLVPGQMRRLIKNQRSNFDFLEMEDSYEIATNLNFRIKLRRRRPLRRRLSRNLRGLRL